MKKLNGTVISQFVHARKLYEVGDTISVDVADDIYEAFAKCVDEQEIKLPNESKKIKKESSVVDTPTEKLVDTTVNEKPTSEYTQEAITLPLEEVKK